MEIGKREIILMSILAGVIYLFIGFNFVWIDTFNNIHDISKELIEFNSQKDELEYDVKNINGLRLRFQNEKNSYERINEVLADDMNITDGAVYLNKFASLSDKDFSKIIVNPPEIVTTGIVSQKTDKKSGKDDENNSNKQTYYDMSIGFSTLMSIEEIEQLIKSIESDTRKVVIKEFDMVPYCIEQDSGETIPSGKFEVDMKIAMFSVGETESKLDEYSRYKFGGDFNISGNPFGEVNQNEIVIEDTEDIDKNIENEDGAKVNENNQESNKSNKTPDPVSSTNSTFSTKLPDISMAGNNEIDIYQVGYHVAGHNVRMYGFDKQKKNILLKSKDKLYTEINLKGSYYSVKVSDDNGGLDSISGSLPLKDNIKLNLNMKYSDTNVDKSMAMDIFIVNETDKRINVKLIDKVGRTMLFDRNGSRIPSSSSLENLYFV